MSAPTVDPVLQGPAPDPAELYANFRPIRYRYVMAFLHDYDEIVSDDVGDTSIVHHVAGEMMDVLPLTGVTYSIGLYGGTNMSGSVYLPDFYLDDMPHIPSFDFERKQHPYQQGAPIGSKFECGNRAIYVMRNDEVVWGGILWTRDYSSGNATMAITAISFDAYVYYRLLRVSMSFNAPVNIYKIWYAVLQQTLTDFTWKGVPYTKGGKTYYKDGGLDGQDADRHKNGDAEKDQRVGWTGLTRSWKNHAGHMVKHSNAPARNYIEAWPNNSPAIRLPPNDLLWKRGTTEVKGTKNFHGYDMAKVGEALEQWADTNTIASSHSKSGLSRFEYRVVCWFDTNDQVFRQRYVFGEMTYADGAPNAPTGIKNPLIGKKGRNSADDPDSAIIFDFPGHISEWSLSETMEDGVTRVIAISGESDAAKHAAYSVQDDLLDVPSSGANRGSQGWLLYDQSINSNATKKVLNKLKNLATKYRKLAHVPQAVQIDDLAAANHPTNQHSSHRCTTLSVALYQDPNTVFPDWTLGDWVTFAIEDPFYGGKMYIIRRIIGYTVTVLPDQESDYSHERIELDLTDDSKVDLQ